MRGDEETRRCEGFTPAETHRKLGERSAGGEAERIKRTPFTHALHNVFVHLKTQKHGQVLSNAAKTTGGDITNCKAVLPNRRQRLITGSGALTTAVRLHV